MKLPIFDNLPGANALDFSQLEVPASILDAPASSNRTNENPIASLEFADSAISSTQDAVSKHTKQSVPVQTEEIQSTLAKLDLTLLKINSLTSELIQIQQAYDTVASENHRVSEDFSQSSVDMPPSTNLMTFDAFQEKYEPIQNEFDEQASMNGTFFDIKGSSLAYVSKLVDKAPNRIWSIRATNNAHTIINGFCVDNVIGYLVTKYGYESSEQIEVTDDLSLLSIACTVSMDLECRTLSSQAQQSELKAFLETQLNTYIASLRDANVISYGVKVSNLNKNP